FFSPEAWTYEHDGAARRGGTPHDADPPYRDHDAESDRPAQPSGALTRRRGMPRRETPPRDRAGRACASHPTCTPKLPRWYGRPDDREWRRRSGLTRTPAPQLAWLLGRRSSGRPWRTSSWSRPGSLATPARPVVGRQFP